VRTILKIVLWTAVVLGVIGGLMYAFLFDVWVVPVDDPVLTASIEPQLAAGDTVLISRSTSPDVGVLVRCTDPDAPARFVIGRIVGKMGDVLDINGGTFTLNGHNVSAPNACDPARVTVRNPVTQEEEEVPCSNEEFAGITHPALRAGIENRKHVEVEGGMAYLLSDNRMMHLDSRDFGSVPAHSCQRISFRLWGSGGYGDTKHRLSVVW
jgi:signal peptidase I